MKFITHFYYYNDHERRMDSFQGGQTVMKFLFANRKLREQPYFTKSLTEKYQISTSRGHDPLAAAYRRP